MPERQVRLSGSEDREDTRHDRAEGISKLIERRVGGLSGKSILDVGCARGWLISELEGQGALCVGIDPFLPTANLKTHSLVKCSANALPFRNDVFDVAASVNSVEHIASPKEALTEVLRVLRVNGVLELDTPNRFSFVVKGPSHSNLVTRVRNFYFCKVRGEMPVRTTHGFNGFVHLFSTWEIHRLLRQAGFRRIDFVEIEGSRGRRFSIPLYLRRHLFLFATKWDSAPKKGVGEPHSASYTDSKLIDQITEPKSLRRKTYNQIKAESMKLLN